MSVTRLPSPSNAQRLVDANGLLFNLNVVRVESQLKLLAPIIVIALLESVSSLRTGIPKKKSDWIPLIRLFQRSSVVSFERLLKAPTSIFAILLLLRLRLVVLDSPLKAPAGSIERRFVLRFNDKILDNPLNVPLLIAAI